MIDSLAPYAVGPRNTRNRRFAEKPHPYRSDFERDRDRIIHAAAFRRLEGKTQVFMPGLDDHYRTRLTHSIEVAQIGRTIARCLRLNETLAEAVCLGHDLGHSPFGHTGEDVLNTLMAAHGGFEHNAQTLRIVDLMEHPYPDFEGLNLMYETRLGFARHHSPYDHAGGEAFADLNCTLEGQIADVADRIAYNCHDLEDGLRSRLIEQTSIADIGLVARAQKLINADKIDDYVVMRTRTSKAMLDCLVSDCLEASRTRIASARPASADDVCGRAEKLIVLSADAEKQIAELERFLMDDLYHNPALLESNRDVQPWLATLFERLCNHIELMPRYFQKMTFTHGLERTVCDYIAGMTDRYCLSMLQTT
jgi:dGTPase